MSFLIIIIVVAIIAAIAVTFILLRNKKQQNSQLPFGNPPQMPPMGGGVGRQNNQPIPTHIPQTNFINDAQNFINQGRYDEAINVLKNGLKTQPNDSNLSLKLLNVYAITNQRDSFNKLYQQIHDQGDIVALQEANNIKALLDEEHQQSQQGSSIQTAPVAQPVKNEVVEDDGLDLDFNLSLDDAPTLEPAKSDSKTSVATDDEPVLSFDDFNDDLSLDEPSTTDTKKATTQDEDAFDLSFDTFNEQDSVKADSPKEDDIALDFALDDNLETIESKPVEKATTSDELDFSLDGLDVATEQAPTEEKVEDTLESNDDFDFDFGTTDTKETSDTASNELTLDDLGGGIELDGLDIGNDFSDLAKEEPSKDADFAELEVDNFDDFGNLGLDTEDKKPVEESSDLALDGFDLGGLDSTEEKTSDITDLDTDIGDDAFDFSVVDEKVSQEDTSTSLDELGKLDDLAFTDEDDAIEEIVIDEPEVPVTPKIEEKAPVIEEVAEEKLPTSTPEPQVSKPVSTDFTNDFSFVQDLDNWQITLDLATKYLDLGENDSAKRLLNEVLENANPEQQKQAKGLLERVV